jgi:hypothetical protein
MLHNTVNNKEGKPREHYHALFSKLDVEEAASRCNVRYNGAFHLNVLGDEYHVSFPCGEFSPALKPNAEILLLRYLCEGRFIPSLGNFLSYAEVPWGNVYLRQFTGRVITRIAKTYGGGIESFAAGVEASNIPHRKIAKGDAGYELDFLPGLFLRLTLYAPDEDFDAAAQLIFSDNFPSAFTAEDMAVVGEVLIDKLKLCLQ